jgi:hypothetical protein
MPRCSRTIAFVLAVGLSASGVAISQLGCEHDVVLPSTASPSICGDGYVEPGEQCDNTSEGCTDCRIAPEWTCPNNVCTPDCDAPGVAASGSRCARTASCNMAGWWAVRETDYTQVTCETVIEHATQWYLYHVLQPEGADRYSIDAALDCGIHVSSRVATVDYTPPTQRFQMYTSGIDQKPHGPRQGDARAVANKCKFSLDRFFFVRGMTNGFLPNDFQNDASLSPVTEAPWLGKPGLPLLPPDTDAAYNTVAPPGTFTTDPPNDAGLTYPGAGFFITGTVDGIRHSAQRDYKGYAATELIAPGLLSFAYYGNYSLQESVLSVTACEPGLCRLLTTPAPPDPAMQPWVAFSYIGLDPEIPGTEPTTSRARSVMGTVGWKQSYDNDLATCANIRLILPHDGSFHDGSSEPDASAPVH